MAVRIRLQRLGKKKSPFYRLVVAESTVSRNGKVIEKIGTYNPLAEPIRLDYKKDRLEHWLSVGALPSDPVQRLLGAEGVIPKVKRASQNLGKSRKELKETKAS